MLRIDGVAVSAQMNLSKKIERAFAARPKPPQVRLADKVLQLDSDVEEALWFSGRDWHELTWQNWQEHSRAIFFFDPEAFGYYLPSVLLLAVENPSESLTADSLISQLDRTPDMEGWTEGFASHFLGLNRAELDVLKEWLLQVCEYAPYQRWGISASGPGDILAVHMIRLTSSRKRPSEGRRVTQMPGERSEFDTPSDGKSSWNLYGSNSAVVDFAPVKAPGSHKLQHH